MNDEKENPNDTSSDDAPTAEELFGSKKFTGKDRELLKKGLDSLKERKGVYQKLFSR